MERNVIQSTIQFTECVDALGMPTNMANQLLMQTVAAIRGVMLGKHSDNEGNPCLISLNGHPNCDTCNVVETVIGALTVGEPPKPKSLIHLVH